jgi:glycosyltransferase involved in cell wall biosynthesis
MMTLSIISATYKRPEKLVNAIKAVIAQDSPSWEYVISPDDGIDYTYLSTIDSRIKVLPAGPIATGPGPTKNRALTRATGDFVAVLEDDDEIPANFVSSVLESVGTRGSCLVPVIYRDSSGLIIRSIAQNLKSINIQTFSKLLCSMHYIGPREIYPLWSDCFAEDVIHTCLGIELSGGNIPICTNTSYFCNTSHDSICNSKGAITQSYEQVIVKAPWGEHFHCAEQIVQLFKDRILADKKYVASGMSVSYHDYYKNGYIE